MANAGHNAVIASTEQDELIIGYHGVYRAAIPGRIFATFTQG